MTASEKSRVLIIDDDADIREVLRTLLELNGFEVETLGDGIGALVLKKDYDAILLDVRMPVFDGERLTDYWLLTNPQVLEKLIIMTGYSQPPGKQARHAFAVMQKPFQTDQILRVVSDCAARSRARKPRKD